MGKSHKKRQRQQQDAIPSILKQKQRQQEDTISDDDLAVTIRTIQSLSTEQFHSKRCKALRQHLHPLMLSYIREAYGNDYRIKTSAALQRQNWAEAFANLTACRDFEQVPKQGTIQRWVRDCSNAPSAVQMKLLQAILSVGQQQDDDDETKNRHDPNTALAKLCESSDVTVLEAWKWWERNETNGELASTDTTNSDLPPLCLDAAHIVYQEDAATRTPPNHFDLILNGNVSISWESPESTVQSIDIPFLPSPARILANTLSPSECQQLVRLLTQLSFRPDHPVGASQPTGIDSCEVMMDSTVLFDRVRHALPDTLDVRGTTMRLHSINARWRGFRYAANCTYRPHLDGSWPYTYMQDDTYHCDNHSPIKSYLTFLMYLNDDFEGGDTRFYLPNQLARGVAPRTGSVLIFPQGNIASLIHEGSQVTSGGVKYVVRTDVLYAPVDTEVAS